MSLSRAKAKYGQVRSGQYWLHIKTRETVRVIARLGNSKWRCAVIDRKGIKASHAVKENVLYTKFVKL